jgi:hypothetical protein
MMHKQLNQHEMVQRPIGMVRRVYLSAGDYRVPLVDFLAQPTDESIVIRAFLGALRKRPVQIPKSHRQVVVLEIGGLGVPGRVDLTLGHVGSQEEQRFLDRRLATPSFVRAAGSIVTGGYAKAD